MVETWVGFASDALDDVVELMCRDCFDPEWAESAPDTAALVAIFFWDDLFEFGFSFIVGTVSMNSLTSLIGLVPLGFSRKKPLSFVPKAGVSTCFFFLTVAD